MSAPWDEERLSAEYLRLNEKLDESTRRCAELGADRDYWRARCEEAETIVVAYGKALRVFEQSLMGRVQA